MADQDLAFAGLAGQAEAVRAGEASPSELVQLHLERIERLEPQLNAFRVVRAERALAEAAEAEKRPPADGEAPLYGVPIAVKDSHDVAGELTTHGTGCVDVPAAEDCEMVKRLRAAGAIVIGKTNLPELAFAMFTESPTWGVTRNPWSTDRVPGGSSGGSGAAVAAGLVAAGTASDGAGSIRYPAAYCGVTGLKPTFGRSAMQGHHMERITSTIVSGPICADAADCRLLGSALFGEELAAGDAAGLRIGVVAGPISEDCAPAVRESCQEAIEALRAETGAEMREIEIEALDMAGLAAVLVGTTEGLGGITPQMLNGLGEEIGEVNRALIKYRMLLPAAVLLRAAKLRALLRRAIARAFEEVDLIAWPTVPAVAPPLARTDVELPSGRIGADPANVRGGGLANLTGIPAISVPVGLSSDGMPIGLQLQAAWGRDSLLLDAAEALERATDRRWVEALPPLARAESAPA